MNDIIILIINNVLIKIINYTIKIKHIYDIGNCISSIPNTLVMITDDIVL